MKKLLCLFVLAFLPVLLPADVTYDEANGKTVQFTVAHDGTGAFTYAWKKDGVAIAGATGKTFTLTSVKATDAGTYTAQVTNKAGTIVSDKGVFTVTVNPTTATITIQTL